MPFAKVNGIEIFYERLGPPTGTPLVLTHGFAGPSGHWKPEIESLAGKRPLVLYDVRGHGRTSVPPDPEAYSLPQFAVDYPELCESVLLCDTTCGNGVDAGPAGDWERRMQVGIGTLAHFVRTYGLEETVRREFEYGALNDPHHAESPYPLEGDLRRIKMMTLEGYLGAAQAMVTRPDLTDRIGAITAPALVMIGEWDDFLPCAMRDHALIPGSRLVVRDRCGHGSRWRADTFIAEVESFLADVETGNPIAIERHV